MNDDANKPAPRAPQNVVAGLIVIAIGVFFLLRNLGIEMPWMQIPNWWALFILVAAVGPLTQAITRYRHVGRFDGTVGRHLLSALTIATIGAMFLMDVRWHLWWPLFIIYGGLWIVLRDRDG
ncbi:LiaF transmembrane domain-containing protein [Oleiagrimonas soli]|uniref:LiaF transmembrane domain-containing protein n=1 Tax=Oleiagrimonas soli TaxID=1543381 RepID=A0A099CUS7_9GAMM|nr:DUF5668 domain-containing protein [Oleiagrimonas soli]KGI77504.1 hypothetical protein LF63_0109190 [Oleiagrimonas soli]MBB6183031.1 hypothetical protein [Oleiagrimonas soli]